MNIVRNFSRFLFGSECLACGVASQPLDPWLCEDCRKKLAEENVSVENGADAFSFYTMGAVSRKLIHGLKYGNMPGMASYLVRNSKAVLEEFKAWLPPHDRLYFVPVPLHSSRFRERGYNQTQKICQALSSPCKGRVLDLLGRRNFSTSQTKLSRGERCANVAGAFFVKKRVKPLARDLFVVVDDVYTTGATTGACLYAMRKYGIENAKVCTMLYERSISAAVDLAADNAVVWDYR